MQKDSDARTRSNNHDMQIDEKRPQRAPVLAAAAAKKKKKKTRTLR